MSLLKKWAGVARPILQSKAFGAVSKGLTRFGPWGAVAGTLGTVLGGAIAGRLSRGGSPGLPGNIGVPSFSAGMGLAGPIVAGGRVAVAGARSAIRSAIAYCKRHPAWCAGIGGVAAVEGLINSGQLPAVKHSRGRGLSSRDLRSFRRVARLIHRYCAPVRSAVRSPAMRGKKC